MKYLLRCEASELYPGSGQVGSLQGAEANETYLWRGHVGCLVGGEVSGIFVGR